MVTVDKIMNGFESSKLSLQGAGSVACELFLNKDAGKRANSVLDSLPEASIRAPDASWSHSLAQLQMNPKARVFAA